MIKHATFCLLLYFASKSVTALECYVTDGQTVITQGLKAKSIRQSCKNFFEEMGLRDLAGSEFRCTTMIAKKGNTAITVQGCLILSKYTCQDLKNDITSMELDSKGVHFDSVECVDCATDLCNDASPSLDVRHRRPHHVSNTTRFVVIGFFLCFGVVFLSMIVVVVVHARRNRNRRKLLLA